jgi:hypothetical protein
MSFGSKLLLLLSFIIIFFNGTPIGYILFQERLGELFGVILFVFTSLLGVLLASVAEDQSSEGIFYVKFSMIVNLLIAFFPLYLHFTSTKIFPGLFNLSVIIH